MGFVHLHTHSHYSMLDGLSKVDEMVKRAKEHGMQALALTDHGALYGLVEFYQKARAAGIQPLLGVEAYVARGSITNHETGERPYHLTLLARNHAGYKNLIALITTAHLNGYYYKPRIDKDMLAKHADGLIILSGCMASEMAQLLLGGKRDKAVELAAWYQSIVGREAFFLEVQHRPTVENSEKVKSATLTLGKELGIPVVATNDSHYTNEDDHLAQDILLCVQTKRRLDDKDRMSFEGENLSLVSEETMQEWFSDNPEVVANAQKVANLVDIDLPLGKITLPHFNVPNGTSPDAYLRDLCLAGLNKRYGIDPSARPTDSSKPLYERLDYELSVIEKTGFAPYFLIVQDFINWAKDQGIVVGPGRGSAAGSIVAYLTNITNIDPLKYDLLFERFLNPERVSMPDIDIDFADDRRDEVIRYVERVYGKDHVAQIITFGTMAARAAVRDVGRVMGLSYTYCDRVAKLIPMFTKLQDALDTVPELKEIYENDDEGKQLLDSAMRLEGVIRHASTHACGVVITKEPLQEYVPTQYASNTDETIITQYDLHAVEDLGLLKMDFLGLKNLTILQKVIMYIDKVRGEIVDLDALPLDDKKTYHLLQSAQTTGVFQLESAGMKRYLKQLKPTTLEDIIAMVALYRPGPMELIPDFIAGKHGLKQTRYLHPKLQPILEKTYGVAVYQEQVLQMARDLAGFTLGEADVLRKAVGKKIASLLSEQREKFITGCVTNGVDEQTATKIFSFIEPFARYGFNRAHAACYALIAYQTAYFKANYPVEFMAALLSSDEENTDRIAIEVNECRGMGIEVLPPDVNESFSTFTVVKASLADNQPRIRFGLKAIKNVGGGLVDVIIAERKAHGPYASLEDFLSRVHHGTMNRKALESFIKCGALDAFGERNQLLENIDQLLSHAKTAEQERASGQTNMFKQLPTTNAPTIALKNAEPASSDQCLTWEKELLGLYISDHPFAEMAKLVEGKVTPLKDVPSLTRRQVRIAGIVSRIQRITTKTNEPMLFVTLEDTMTSLEILVFPSVLKEHPELWQEDRCVLIDGRRSEKEGRISVICNKGIHLTPETAGKHLRPSRRAPEENKAPPPPSEPSAICEIRVPQIARPDLFNELKRIMRDYPGTAQVRLIVLNAEQPKTIETNVLIHPSPEFVTRVEHLIGPETVLTHTPHAQA